MPSRRVTELKRFLDQLVRIPDADHEPSVEERLVYDQAIDNFLSAGPALLDDATDSLWAYYRSVASRFTAAERVAYGIPEIPPTSDIWDQVHFASGPPELRLGGTKLEPGDSYISFEGEVSWEPEHGLQLVFEHGRRVCKVGPYDGHNTNAHAYGDESLVDVVFMD